MCVVCQIAMTGAAAIASVVPAVGSTETTSSSAVSSQSVSANSDTLALSPVSLRVDDVDVKGCVTPGQTVTASGSGFDVASSTPKVFIAFGLFYGKHPEASQVISVEGSVKSATSMSFVVPAASRFGKSSIAGANLTVVWSSSNTYGMGPMIPFVVCAAGTSGGTSGGTSQSGNSGSSSKPTATTVAKSSGTTSLVGKKCAPAGLTLTVYGTKVICKKSGSTLRWAVAGK